MSSGISDLHYIFDITLLPFAAYLSLSPSLSTNRYDSNRFILFTYLIVYHRKKKIYHHGNEHANTYLLSCPVVYGKCNVHCIECTEAVLHPVSFLVEINNLRSVHIQYI